MFYKNKYLKYKQKYLLLQKYYNQLGGIVIDTNINMGTDLIIYRDNDKIYISTHLKEYKKNTEDDEFLIQINNIIKYIKQNIKDNEKYILMMDANTQLQLLSNVLIITNKEGKKQYDIQIDDSLQISFLPSSFPTSNKMRGTHTAQLNKTLNPVSAIIDHIIMFESSSQTRTREKETLSHYINDHGILTVITDNNTSTTSPNSIPDHAFVISTIDRSSYGTLNIKGGDINNLGWAEFVPKEFYDIFNTENIKNEIDLKLIEIFDPLSIEQIKEQKFLSAIRLNLFDIHFPNILVPDITKNIEQREIIFNFGNVYEIKIKNIDNNLHIQCQNDNSVILSEFNIESLKDKDIHPLIKEFINKLKIEFVTNNKIINDNFETKWDFFYEKGYLLLKFWHEIQTKSSLSDIFENWYNKTKDKVSIKNMISQAKRMYPNLKSIGLQEVPPTTHGIQFINNLNDELTNEFPNVRIIYNSKNTNIKTQGAIILF